MCVAVTVTPGNLDPDGSETVPTMPAVVSCAMRSGELNPSTASAHTRTTAGQQMRFVIHVAPL
jgi:hypothetical protein